MDTMDVPAFVGESSGIAVIANAMDTNGGRAFRTKEPSS
jgi:hypothetical protein